MLNRYYLSVFYFLMTRQINKSNLKGMIFCFVFPKSISSRTMFCTKVTYDSRVVDNMLSFYVNTQINLLPEGMVTIHATKLKNDDFRKGWRGLAVKSC